MKRIIELGVCTDTQQIEPPGHSVWSSQGAKGPAHEATSVHVMLDRQQPCGGVHDVAPQVT
jgi:hypothetical protein